jgi:hypothetical protein
VTLGGIATDFRPQQVSDRVFCFVVASKNVRFHVSPTINVRFYSIFGEMVVQIGFMNMGSSCLKRLISGLWFIERNTIRRNLTVM